MAPSTIRKAIGAVKDQTSISLAKVAGNIAPDLEVLVVKATTHDEDPADEKYISQIISMASSSEGYVSAAVATVSRRLSRTHDWIVALKGLMLVHRLTVDGHCGFMEEVVFAERRGMRVLNMEGFRDEAHSSSWDHAGFVRSYAMYLDVKVEFEVRERKSRRGSGNGSGGGQFEDRDMRSMEREEKMYSSNVGTSTTTTTPVREMRGERVLGRVNDLLRIIDRVLGCKPAGLARTSRLVIVALYAVVKESFRVYVEICEALGVLLDRFGEMEYADCVRAFDAYVNAAKVIDEVWLFYNWCKDMGIARTSEYPEVMRITDQLLGTLEGFLKEKTSRPKGSSPGREDKGFVGEETKHVTEIKALPAPENYTPSPVAAPVVQPKPAAEVPRVTNDLVNLRDDGITADGEGNKFALALFSGTVSTKTNGEWEAFDSNGETEVTSAWQTPAAERGKADWELALVETASNLSKQKADLGGGFDSLLLNGMYDQGTVRQHVSTSQLSGGSASSVAMPLPPGKGTTPLLALPAPDGTVQAVGQQDPFAPSLTVPPPSYVQIADMERKQQLLSQEQLLWQQYGRDGMQGQVSLAKLSGGSGYYVGPQPMPYGMPQPGGYYYAPPF